jgi:peroxiredoxin
MKTRSILTALILAAGLGVSASFAQPTATPATGKGTQPATQPATGEGKKHDDKKDAKKDEKKAEVKAAKVGDVAPAFSLMDTDGKTVKLEDYKGKVVVLEWFNAECPFSGIKHHKEHQTFNTLHEEYNTKGVVFLAICSSASGQQGYGKDFNAKAKTDLKVPYPILLDETGATGHAYGATNTPHCFVIGTDGKLAYAGAIDNERAQDKVGDKNYVKMALDNVLAGKAADPATTRPYGCPVKFAGK